MKITRRSGRPVWHARANFADQIIAASTTTTMAMVDTGPFAGIYQDTHGFFDLDNNQIVFPADGTYFGVVHITVDVGQGYYFWGTSTSSSEFDEHQTYVNPDAAPGGIGPRLNIPWGPRFFLGGETMEFFMFHTVTSPGSINFSDFIVSVARLDV